MMPQQEYVFVYYLFQYGKKLFIYYMYLMLYCCNCSYVLLHTVLLHILSIIAIFSRCRISSTNSKNNYNTPHAILFFLNITIIVRTLFLNV